MPNSHNADALILNVDDSDGARYAKSRILVRAGFRVIEAANGEEALEIAHREKPTLILLDVKLPDIDGMEVCRRLKENSDTNSILVLQTSASFIGAADKIRALDGGADNYLVEPIEPDELIANVNALLRLGRVERELREIDRRRNEFLATLAHELRNPLGPIRNSVELLRRLDPDVPPLQKNARDTIQRHTDHLSHLVDDLLDISRISRGKISLRWEQIDLKSFVESAIEISQLAIDSRNHKLHVELPEQAVHVNGDRVRLSQILANLLLNAAKFTEQGGNIKLNASCDQGKLIIRVSDDGIGIASENLESIFELFSQSGRTTDKMSEGLGIGLSLVRSLAKLHGGQVKAFSEGLGKGSLFELSLPIQIETEQSRDSKGDTPAFFPLRIIVIDDNQDAAVTLAQLLEFSGHVVRTAFTAAEGYETASLFKPDVIFLDIGLPDKNGYDLALDMAALPNRTKFKLIALTGYGQQRDKKDAMAAGFDEHFVKPMDFSKLQALGIHI